MPADIKTPDLTSAPSVLKPCPFCGRQPKTLPSGYTGCSAQDCSPYSSPSAWNRRASDSIKEDDSSLTYADRNAAPSMGWQPISTAPKDGTFILAAYSGGHRNIVQWSSYDYCWRTNLENPTKWSPAAWQPLPAPPTDGAPVEPPKVRQSPPVTEEDVEAVVEAVRIAVRDNWGDGCSRCCPNEGDPRFAIGDRCSCKEMAELTARAAIAAMPSLEKMREYTDRLSAEATTREGRVQNLLERLEAGREAVIEECAAIAHRELEREKAIQKLGGKVLGGIAVANCIEICIRSLKTAPPASERDRELGADDAEFGMKP